MAPGKTPRPPLNEPTLDELLADPMMELVLQRSQITKHDLRKLMANAASHRTKGPLEVTGAAAREPKKGE